MQRNATKLARGQRDGFVLVIAIFAVVIIGALVAGATFAVTQEHRVAHNAVIEQRAFAAAEAGLNGALVEWGSAASSLSIPAQGDDTSYTVATAAGDPTVVTVTRLTDSTVWVASEGTAASSDPRLRTTRRTSMVLRLRADTLRPVAQRSWAQLF